jgi:hypothetical protein
MAQSIVKFGRFVGPGFLIAVAYIDPGNYATDVAGGAQFKYALLFIVLLSNLFAILLQSLCVKLGTVTGLNLAENCREHLPKWLVIILYIFAESAIVATDIAEVTCLSPCMRAFYSSERVKTNDRHYRLLDRRLHSISCSRYLWLLDAPLLWPTFFSSSFSTDRMVPCGAYDCLNSSSWL